MHLWKRVTRSLVASLDTAQLAFAVDRLRLQSSGLGVYTKLRTCRKEEWEARAVEGIEIELKTTDLLFLWARWSGRKLRKQEGRGMKSEGLELWAQEKTVPAMEELEQGNQAELWGWELWLPGAGYTGLRRGHRDENSTPWICRWVPSFPYCHPKSSTYHPLTQGTWVWGAQGTAQAMVRTEPESWGSSPPCLEAYIMGRVTSRMKGTGSRGTLGDRPTHITKSL